MAGEVIVAGVTPVYPRPEAPSTGTFVRSLFRAMHACSATVRVVAPYSLTRALATRVVSRASDAVTDEFPVWRPGFWSLPGRLAPWWRIGDRVSLRRFGAAASRDLPRAATNATFIYCHFLASGLAGLRVGSALGIPVIVALGESNLAYYDSLIGRASFDRALTEFAGIIAVSKENEAFCRSRVPSVGDRILHIPNAVDISTFFPHDRQEARAKLGLPSDGSIAVFAGHFIARKGALRVLGALDRLDGVRGVFLGRGPETLRGPLVLHAGPVPHQLMPWWLSAADVFVLPSLAEGMSNAIIEALACGLPVVVSDRPFNHEFLDSSCAILVDPQDDAAIADGLRQVLTDSARRHDMSLSARRVAESHDLVDRARTILDFGQRVVY